MMKTFDEYLAMKSERYKQNPFVYLLIEIITVDVVVVEIIA